MLRDGIEITCNDLTSVKVVYVVVAVSIITMGKVMYYFRVYSYGREFFLLVDVMGRVKVQLNSYILFKISHLWVSILL